jgi:hypothetical protein
VCYTIGSTYRPKEHDMYKRETVATIALALLIAALILTTLSTYTTTPQPTPDINCGPVTYSDGTVREECWEVTCQEDMACWAPQ